MNHTLSRMREKRANDEGFTLIELLVVVVIIGVLVAIAVPVYLNYRKGAADKSAQSDVRGSISAIEQYYTDNGNAYPTTAIASAGPGDAALNIGGGQKITLSDKTVFTYIPTPAVAPATIVASYVVCATNSGGSGKVYVYNSLNGGSVSAPTTAPSITTCA
jgi:type IV pilus assembly protein PilA